MPLEPHLERRLNELILTLHREDDAFNLNIDMGERKKLIKERHGKFPELTAEKLKARLWEAEEAQKLAGDSKEIKDNRMKESIIAFTLRTVLGVPMETSVENHLLATALRRKTTEASLTDKIVRSAVSETKKPLPTISQGSQLKWQKPAESKDPGEISKYYKRILLKSPKLWAMYKDFGPWPINLTGQHILKHFNLKKKLRENSDLLSFLPETHAKILRRFYLDGWKLNEIAKEVYGARSRLRVQQERDEAAKAVEL